MACASVVQLSFIMGYYLPPEVGTVVRLSDWLLFGFRTVIPSSPERNCRSDVTPEQHRARIYTAQPLDKHVTALETNPVDAPVPASAYESDTCGAECVTAGVLLGL